MTDKIPTVDELAHQEYLIAAARHKNVVEENPVCQKCRENPSVAINRWGTILAVCADCLKDELRAFEKSCRDTAEAREGDDYY
jgi:hypothetical protein